MTGTLYLGTSGYSYDEWKHGVFYPQDLKNREMLSYYASVLNSVEINYTFRRFPSEKTITTWREETPDTFRFTLKANQRITHHRRLSGAEQDVSDFAKRAGGLGDRLGCLLFQCPPSLQYDAGLIEGFVKSLPDGTRAAMEFRHASWRQAREVLLGHGVAWCVAETDEHDPGQDDLSWAPFGFLRLRKSSYTDEEILAWAKKISGAAAEGHDVFCYFKHEDEGASPKMAKRLQEALIRPLDHA